MQVIVGLGNPGKKYQGNRHNVGFEIIDYIAKTSNFAPWRKKFQSKISEGTVNSSKVLLVKPETFMNNSGFAIKELFLFYKLNVDNLIVIHDDLDLKLGKIKVKNGGGHNGHNGLKSIDKMIGKNYNRVRVGVSRPSKVYEENIDENISNWVLSDFTSNEKAQWLDNTINYVSEMIISLINSQNSFWEKNV